MDKIELRPAYEWTCENCGQDWFERAIIPELTPEDIAKIEEKTGASFAPNENWNIKCQLAPIEVTCKKCGESYETVDDIDNEENYDFGQDDQPE